MHCLSLHACSVPRRCGLKRRVKTPRRSSPCPLRHPNTQPSRDSLNLWLFANPSTDTTPISNVTPEERNTHLSANRRRTALYVATRFISKHNNNLLFGLLLLLLYTTKIINVVVIKNQVSHIILTSHIFVNC